MNPAAGIVAAGDAYSERPIIEEPHLLRPFDEPRRDEGIHQTQEEYKNYLE